MFKIKDKELEIQHAYLDAYINAEHLIFGLNIKACSDEFINGQEVSISSDTILKVRPNQIKKWEDIVGHEIYLKEYTDIQEPNALLDIFEQEPIYDADIIFKKTDNKTTIDIRGFCDIYYDEEYYENIPLEVNTEVDFYGVLCGSDMTSQECLHNVSRFLDIGLMKFERNKYNVGVVFPKDTDIHNNKLILGEY